MAKPIAVRGNAPSLIHFRNERSKLLSRPVGYERGLNCRPLWHFCKQKSPIPSQLPHVFGFWLSFRRWLDYWGRSARTKNWRKIRKAFYWFSELSDFEGIGAIRGANRRKGQRPLLFYKKGLSNCRQKRWLWGKTAMARDGGVAKTTESVLLDFRTLRF